MSAARLRLVLPGLRPGTTVTDAAPAPLARLLARADWRRDGSSTRAALLGSFGHAPGAALAPLFALHDLDVRADLQAESAGWLRADPVYFRADAKLVLLIAPAADEIAPDEADEYLAELRAALPEHEWRRGASPGRWYVRGPALPASPALGPAWLHGRSVTPFFPQDAAHRPWRQLMSEAQMVMHAAAANARREARGISPLNALWLWGGGEPAPDGSMAAPTVAAAVGSDLLLAGLARSRGVEWTAHPGPDSLRGLPAGATIVGVCGVPFGAAAADAADVAADAARWATLAWEALGDGALEAVELFGEGLRGELRPSARWRLWRRRPPGQFGDPHDVEAGS
jgi:hypothetical protein